MVKARKNTVSFFDKLREKKILFLLGLGVVIFLGVLVWWWTKPKELTAQLKEDLVPSKPGRVEKPAPEVSFENYKLETSLPVLPSSLPLYQLKTDYSSSEVRALGERLGLRELKSEGDWMVLVNTTEEEKAGYLFFNQETGVFLFESFGNHRPSFGFGGVKVVEPKRVAQKFLEELGLIDERVMAYATYEKTTTPGVTYVEFHRDWEKTGAPIVNIIGLLNQDERLRLADLKLAQIDKNTPDDLTIINVSDGYSGKERPDDFNTITVGVTAEGRIVSIRSNLRQMEKVETLTNQNSKRQTAEQAFEAVKGGKGIFKLTKPSGQGLPNLARVYPENKAKGERVTVTDAILAYVEKPQYLPQRFLQPVYVFKGDAQLDSGFRINWVEVVPVVVETQLVDSEASAIEELMEIIVPRDGRTLQLGTFRPTVRPRPTTEPAPTSPAAIFTPKPTRPPLEILPEEPTKPLCLPSEENLDPIYDLDGLGRVGLYVTRTRMIETAMYYYVPPHYNNLPDLEAVIAEFEKLDLEKGITQVRPRDQLEEDWERNFVCPIRITGGSPTLFVYAKNAKAETKKAEIKMGKGLTYAEPALREGIWEVEVKGEGSLLVNGLKRDYLYYEYESFSFEKPSSGWVIERGKLETLARKKLSPALGLLPLEEERLVFELNHAAFGITSDSVFVGLIPQEEVEEKLPLEITPKPEKAIRLHFYLSPASGNERVLAPKLSPIERADFMLLELGAVKGN